MNFKQAEEYLNFLIEAELIMVDSDGNKPIYQITDKGAKMLERYRELIELKP